MLMQIYISDYLLEVIKREPGSLGVRKWGLYGRYYLRHLNELEHELSARLAREESTLSYFPWFYFKFMGRDVLVSTLTLKVKTWFAEFCRSDLTFQENIYRCLLYLLVCSFVYKFDFRTVKKLYFLTWISTSEPDWNSRTISRLYLISDHYLVWLTLLKFFISLHKYKVQSPTKTKQSEDFIRP